MMGFLNNKIQNNKKVGTPTKKIKPNQDNQSVNSDWQIPLGNLVFIKNISNTELSIIPQRRQSGQFQISAFSINQGSDFNKQNNSYQMNKIQDMDIQNELKIPQKLNKRINSAQKFQIKQYDHLLTQLTMSKHNSTFPVVDFTGIDDSQQFGQNIYLNQLLTLKSRISLTDANNQNRQILRQFKNQAPTQQNRLQQNYQIKQNLGKYKPNKQGFICLNKLQKIFYYVKKINLGKNNIVCQSPVYSQSDHYSLEKFLSSLTTSKREIVALTETDLVREQIKLYNKDSQGRLVRFYQEWIQNNNLFMIYELSSYSLADKTIANQRLPQSEIWSIIYDSIQCLKWLYQNNKVHMNIKPGNILKLRNKYKLSDPLVSIQFMRNKLRSMNCSMDKFYLAPELIQFQQYLQGIDYGKCEVFSLGMSVLENITGLPRSMKGLSLGEIRSYYKKQMHGYSSYLRRLLLRMIDKNYKKRPKFDELLCQNMDDEMKINNKTRYKRSNSV